MATGWQRDSLPPGTARGLGSAPAAGRASRPARPAGSERPGRRESPAGSERPGHRESLPPGTARGLGTPRPQGEPRGLGSAAGPGGSCPATTAPLGPAAPRVTAVPEVKQRGVFRAERAPRGKAVSACRYCDRTETAAAALKGWEIPIVEFFYFVCRRSDGGSASKPTTTFCK
ncbi:spidroin-2-like isoform X2 [Pyrgilauda ruficollis]|nr:spidroin-2-like isoform X2 [Pyrgilauda ruficollis]